jgi:fibro-slime domain-containing protein
MTSLRHIQGLLLLGALSASFVANAATITLTGTVRDFTPANPDFENPITGFDPGIVAGTLGADHKPVYANPLGSTPTTHGVAAFDPWFHRPLNEGVDSKTVPITLTQSGDVYTYSNGGFFPIDNELLGNYALGHNYHFTFELHTTFTYTGPETFSFSGDDDVWVFINNQRVIDLGGIHGPLSASVNTGSLSLIEGEDYPLDFFFAERHTVGSNFSITTGLILEDAPPVDGAVPEPSTWLAATALAALIARRATRARRA